MFGYTYHMQIVNPEKGIIKLAPTLGTYAKAFGPVLVIWGLLGLLMLDSSEKVELREVDTDFDETQK